MSSNPGIEAVTRPARARGQRRAPDALDAALGARLRSRRLTAGLSQSTLGEAVGVSPQQIQKYESGGDRISAATLLRAAAALGCDLATLCSGLEAGSPSRARPGAKSVRGESVDLLIESYLAIPQSPVRRDIQRLIATLAASAGRGKTHQAAQDG